jgi:hypothetical protein
MVEYFEDNIGVAEVTGVIPVPNMVVPTPGGAVLVSPEASTITLTLFNPRNFNVLYELLGVPAGKTITANQAGNTIEVDIAEAVLDDEYDLTLTMQSPDGLRDFTPYNLPVRCVSFDTALKDFSVDFGEGVLRPVQKNGCFDIIVPSGVTAITLSAEMLTPGTPSSRVELYGVSPVNGPIGSSGIGGGFYTGIIALPTIGSYKYYIRITSQSGGEYKDYPVNIFKGDSSKAITDFSITSPVTAVGTIDEAAKTVTVTVPDGTTLTALTVSVTHTGISVTSPSGATQDGSPAIFSGQDFIVSPQTYTVTAEDGTTQSYAVTVKTSGTNAELSALTVSVGTLSPAFTAGTLAYTVSVPSGTSSITLTGTPVESAATVEYKMGAGSWQNGGNFTGLVTGSNFFEVRVTALDGATTNTYAVTVSVTAANNADLSDLTVSTGTLSPATFVAGTTAYTVTVPSGTSAITLTGTKADSTATLEYQKNGNALQPTGAFFALATGDVLRVYVTAQDGVTTQTYSVAVNILAYGYTYSDEGTNRKITVTGTLDAVTVKALLQSPPETTHIVDLSGATADLSSDYPFPWASSIIKIILPDNTPANGIHSYFFDSTQNLETIEIAPANTAYEVVNGVLYNKSKSTLVRYPPKLGGPTCISYTAESTATQTYPSAFRYTAYLTQVNLSNINMIERECFEYSSVQEVTAVNLSGTIRYYTFQYSSLTKLVIPSAVSSIGNQAFRGCASLQWIEIQRTTPPTADFDGIGTAAANGIMGESVATLAGRNFWIYVPAAAVATYQSAPGWSVYASRITAGPPPP